MPAKGREQFVAHMTQEATGLPPAASAESAALHPKITRVLESGEQIIRTGRGRGLSLTVTECVLLGLFALLFGAGIVRAIETGVPFNLAWAAVMAIIVPLIIWGAAAKSHGSVWALTNRRLLFVCGPNPSWPMNWAWSLSNRRPYAPRIRELTVTGGKDHGRIALRGMSWGNVPAVTLTGVDRPLELAALIKSTLALDLPVEDYTR